MFKKFPSIENTYREIQVARWLKLFPEIASVTFTITEKIHGTNVQFIFDQEKYAEEVVLASRGHVLKENESHYGLRDTLLLPKYKRLINAIQNYGLETNLKLNIYGEFFGGSLMSGIDYGNHKRIRCFAATINGKFLPTSDFKILLEKLKLPLHDYMVPMIDLVHGLDKALKYPIESIISRFTPDPLIKKYSKNPKNLIEGIVISPTYYTYEETYTSKIFLLKKKND